jgi:hypothetical protein
MYEAAKLSLADFIRTFAEAHYAPGVRHLSEYEYGMLQRVADQLEVNEHMTQKVTRWALRADVPPLPPMTHNIKGWGRL